MITRRMPLTWNAECKLRREGLHRCVLGHFLQDTSSWEESKDDCDRGASLRAAREVGRRDRYGIGMGDVAHLRLAYELRRHLPPKLYRKPKKIRERVD